MARRTGLSPVELHRLLDYDPETGVFTWRVKRKGRPYGWIPAGTQAGSVWADGYRRVMINGVSYLANQLAFLFMTGQWPRYQMDHENRNRSDNRWSNLREATPRENQGNTFNTSNALGLKGVCYEKDRRKYKAYIEVGGRSVNLGRFETAEEASTAYAAAARKYFGAFARTNE